MTNPRIDLDKIKTILEDVAAEHLMPHYLALKADEVHEKSPGDIVTIADLEVESALTPRLLEALPGSKLLGEESFYANNGLLDLFLGQDPVWIVDPLDGTAFFRDGSGLFGIIVALSVQNQAVAGWLYDPVLKQCVMAEKGAGAYLNGRRLSVVAPATLQDQWGSFGRRIMSRYPPDPQGAQVFAMKSACHEYARLATPDWQGPGDRQQTFRANLNQCTPWDDVAGTLVHTESGGYSACWDGSPVCANIYNKGALQAPDPDSWHALRTWINGFCPVSAE